MTGILQAFFGGQEHEAGGAETPLWLITFTDLMGLMLTFFVLIYAASAPSGTAWQALGSAFRGEAAAGGAVLGTSDRGSAGLAAPLKGARGRLETGYLAAVLETGGVASSRDQTALARQVTQASGNQLVLLTRADRLIPAGMRTLTIEGEDFLHRLAAVLQYASNPLQIRVTVPAGPTGGFGTDTGDWRLAFDRAAILRDRLREGGYTGTIDLSAEVASDAGSGIAIVIAGVKEANW